MRLLVIKNARAVKLKPGAVQERSSVKIMAATKRRRRRNQATGDFPVGEYVPVEAVKINGDGTLNVVMEDSQLMDVLSTENRRRHNPHGRRNITAGFYDEDGIFHPIRASRDYDSARAGDRPRATKSKSKTKRRKR